MLDYDKDKFTLKDVETNEIRYLSTTKGFGENLEPRISISTSSDKNEAFTKYVEVESAKVLFVQLKVKCGPTSKHLKDIS